MNIKSINVLGTRYKVKYVEKLENENWLGLCNRETKTIYIKTGQTKENEMITFIHELLHSLIGESSIDQSLSNELEEIIVDLMAKFWVSLFKQLKKNYEKTKKKI